MKQRQLGRSLVLAAVIGLGAGGSAWAAERALTMTLPADPTLSMARFYTAPAMNVGNFPGTIVRLSCESEGSSKDPEEQTKHDYALILHGDDVIHPLLPATDEVRREFRSPGLQGTDVSVQGKYYPSTGAILVSRAVINTAPDTAAGTSAQHLAADQPKVSLTTGFDRRHLVVCAND